MKKSELKDLIRECLSELTQSSVEEDKLNQDDSNPNLEEMTGTGAVAGYNTPFAFGKNDKKTKKTAEQLGYKLVKEDEELLSEARYHNFRNHPMKEHAKLSLCLREVKKMLREIDFLTNISDKLKLEAGVSSEAYWNTIKERDIPEIYGRLKEIQNKLNRLTEKKGKI